MLAPLRSTLSQMKIILGSQSPRRRELLSPFFSFAVVPSTFDESTIPLNLCSFKLRKSAKKLPAVCQMPI
jgi:predicted house-cleaning NTP pyrophosphatase (Maf/HAM1 superfamily)